MLCSPLLLPADKDDDGTRGANGSAVAVLAATNTASAAVERKAANTGTLATASPLVDSCMPFSYLNTNQELFPGGKKRYQAMYLMMVTKAAV
jgi:hypothetical protein